MRRALALSAVVLAAVAAGCGGDDEPATTSATTEWADGFCTAFTTWTSELQSHVQALTLSPSAETVQAVADDAKSATDEFLVELDALGAPATESGQEVVAAAEGLASTLEEQISVIESTVEGLDEPTGVSTTVPAISEAFATMRTASVTALQEIQQAAAGSELEDAFEQTPSCDPLTDTI